MLKIRLQGTVKDIRWFKRLLEKHPEIRVIQVSEIFSNKGTNRYFRFYAKSTAGGKDVRSLFYPKMQITIILIFFPAQMQ